MRKSAAVKLTLVPMLAASALAYAQAPGETGSTPAPVGQSLPEDALPDSRHLPLPWLDGAPGFIEPVLSPPGMTPTIDELACDEDPNWELRDDCADDEGTGGGAYVGGGGVVRGGYGGYFWTGGG